MTSSVAEKDLRRERKRILAEFAEEGVDPWEGAPTHSLRGRPLTNLERYRLFERKFLRSLGMTDERIAVAPNITPVHLHILLRSVGIDSDQALNSPRPWEPIEKAPLTRDQVRGRAPTAT